jgi:hypothetical protein
MTSSQYIQKRFWEFFYPVFPFIERLARPFKMSGRQNYLLGRLHPERTLDELQERLRGWDFEHVVMAWTDDGQVLSWRKRVSFTHQYHIRVFEDGEIRGHYEYAPEAAPLWHLLEVGQVPREEDFRAFLGEHLIAEAEEREYERRAIF